MAEREGLAELCSGASHSRFARPFFTSVCDLRFVEPRGSHPSIEVGNADDTYLLVNYIYGVAEREGLIRFAQGCAPKPAALPLSSSRNR